jgi:hypothetical protein
VWEWGAVSSAPTLEIPFASSVKIYSNTGKLPPGLSLTRPIVIGCVSCQFQVVTVSLTGCISFVGIFVGIHSVRASHFPPPPFPPSAPDLLQRYPGWNFLLTQVHKTYTMKAIYEQVPLTIPPSSHPM